MRNMKSLLSVVALTASFGFAASEGWAKDGVLSSGEFGKTNYCHMHFSAIDEKTLSSDRPILKEPSTGDIIHFDGRCDYDPHGKDAVQAQRRDLQHRWSREYGS